MSVYEGNLQRVRANSSTDANFPSRVPTSTAPAGDGVIFDPLAGSSAPEWLQVIPFGDGADNATFDLRVIGWKPTPLGLWIPTILAQAACTLSTAVGVNSYEVTASQRFADTIVLSLIQANVDSKVSSPANDTPGSFQVQTRGSVFIEVIFDMGTATGANALISWV